MLKLNCLFALFSQKGEGESEEHIPGGYCFLINHSLMRKIDMRQRIPPLSTSETNTVSWLHGDRKEGDWSGGDQGKDKVTPWWRSER